MIRRNPFEAAPNAAAVQRSAIDPLCQFFTRRIRSRYDRPGSPWLRLGPEPELRWCCRASFPAPPTEGRRFRIGLGLGIGALVVLLVCGGGVAAAVGLTAVMFAGLSTLEDSDWAEIRAQSQAASEAAKAQRTT